MPIRVGSVYFPAWESLEVEPGCFTDTFIYPVSYLDGLPPAEVAELIGSFAPEVDRARRGSASFWIKVYAPGLWYPLELRRCLLGLPVPYAVTRGENRPCGADFSYVPWVSRVKAPGPPLALHDQTVMEYRGLNYLDLGGDALACLRVLGRITSGYTSEIASLAGFGLARTKAALHELVDRGLIGLVFPAREGERETRTIENVGEAGKRVSIQAAREARRIDISRGEREYPHWKIHRNGISLALRSWGVPPRHEFINRRERRTPAVGRHRTAAHQWPAWLKKAWPHAQIWTGWSEVKIPKWSSYPDALAWGRLDDRETLFWLEVESGHSAGSLIMKKTARRLLLAGEYAKSMRLRLVFAFLGMPWVRSAARLAFVGIPEHVAVVVGDWQQFGVLPAPQWGRARFIGE